MSEPRSGQRSFSVGALLSAALSEDGAVPSRIVVLQIEGMTCEARAPEVRRHLLEVPAVLDAVVSYERQLAEIRVRAEFGPEISSLREAVRQPGYAARPDQARGS